jgi:hypothetical protein
MPELEVLPEGSKPEGSKFVPDASSVGASLTSRTSKEAFAVVASVPSVTL